MDAETYVAGGRGQGRYVCMDVGVDAGMDAGMDDLRCRIPDSGVGFRCSTEWLVWREGRGLVIGG